MHAAVLCLVALTTAAVENDLTIGKRPKGHKCLIRGTRCGPLNSYTCGILRCLFQT